jgi:hypothetical protein
VKQEAKVVYLLECLNKTSPPVSILLKSLRRWKFCAKTVQVISCSYFSQSALRKGCPNRNPF